MDFLSSISYRKLKILIIMSIKHKVSDTDNKTDLMNSLKEIFRNQLNEVTEKNFNQSQEQIFKVTANAAAFMKNVNTKLTNLQMAKTAKELFENREPRVKAPKFQRA